MPNCLAVSGETGRSVREIPLSLHVADREAKVGPVTQAVHALAALWREEGDDLVAGRKRGDALGFDFSSWRNDSTSRTSASPAFGPASSTS